MSNLRRTTPFLKEICTQVCKKQIRRDLHVSSSAFAKAIAPRTTRASRIRRSQSSPEKVAVRKLKYTVEDTMPPIALVRTACKSGAIKSDPEDCMTFLQVYVEEAATSCRAQDRALCDNSTITPFEMAVMGSICNRCPTIPQKSLGKALMISASELGDKFATFELVTSALRTGKLEDYGNTLVQLDILARLKHDPQAMLLVGKIRRGRGKQGNIDALEWFQKATRPPHGSIEWDGAGEALVEEGRMLQSEGAMLGAMKAFEQAALILDDPTAYFYLSKLEELGSAKQELYLKKASSAGILEAWHNLGALELSKDTGGKIRKLNDYGMAREWFLVAAADGFGLSMLNLAIMHKSVGDVEGATEWLNKAEDTEGVADEAKILKRQWASEMKA